MVQVDVILAQTGLLAHILQIKKKQPNVIKAQGYYQISGSVSYSEPHAWIQMSHFLCDEYCWKLWTDSVI